MAAKKSKRSFWSKIIVNLQLDISSFTVVRKSVYVLHGPVYE